jgi:large subunit ribosomal protein L29
MAEILSAQSLREMEADQLAEHAFKARRELFDLRFRHATGELENNSSIGIAKRNVARTLTICRERGIEVARSIES